MKKPTVTRKRGGQKCNKNAARATKTEKITLRIPIPWLEIHRAEAANSGETLSRVLLARIDPAKYLKINRRKFKILDARKVCAIMQTPEGISPRKTNRRASPIAQ